MACLQGGESLGKQVKICVGYMCKFQIKRNYFIACISVQEEINIVYLPQGRDDSRVRNKIHFDQIVCCLVVI